MFREKVRSPDQESDIDVLQSASNDAALCALHTLVTCELNNDWTKQSIFERFGQDKVRQKTVEGYF